MTIDEMVVKVGDAIDALKEVSEYLGTLIEGVEEPPKPELKEWKWEGVIGVQPEVLGTFPPGEYEFDLRVKVKPELVGSKKDFRFLLIDRLDLKRGMDPDVQFHVENGEKHSRLFLGGHSHLGGPGWPGVEHDYDGVGFMNSPSRLWNFVPVAVAVAVPSEFALVLGEMVTHDRGRVTSPAGARYEIVMRKVG